MTDSTDSRAAILDAAEQLFARQGFAATTIKQIGSQAGVNAALLYYYFTSKATLYEEMLRRRIEGLIAFAGDRLGPRSDPAEAITAFLVGYSEYMLAHPALPRIIARELLDHEAARAAPVIRVIAGGVFRRLCEVIRQGQEQGRFRSDLRPEFAAISTVSQVVYFIVARPAAAILLGYGPGGPPDQVVRQFARHAAEFALAALRPEPPLNGSSS